MEVPNDIKEFAGLMHLAFELVASTSDEGIDYLLQSAPVEARPGAKRFLIEFLAANPTSDKIDEMWGRAGADVFLPRPPREFLVSLRDRL